jgi:hypothetical protein
MLELEDHLADIIDAACAQGVARDDAEEAAIARLGTPDQIAAAYKTSRRPIVMRNAAIVLVAATVSGFAATQYAAGSGDNTATTPVRQVPIQVVVPRSSHLRCTRPQHDRLKDVRASNRPSRPTAKCSTAHMEHSAK